MIIGIQLTFSDFCGKALYNTYGMIRMAFRSWEYLIWEALD